MQNLTKLSGAKVLLALKCFSGWGVFDLMRDSMQGTTSSSLYEVRLGREEFGKETHAYSVAFADHEINETVSYADKIIFNSLSQLQRFAPNCRSIARGLRINPLISVSGFDLADPARPYSRLGEKSHEQITKALPLISGFMIHNNCENNDFLKFDTMLTKIEQKFGMFFHKVDWLSLGGGLAFTEAEYPLEKFAQRLKKFQEQYQLQLYLEPGEASISNTTSLEVTILDIIENEKKIAIVDASIEAHMLDLLIYRQNAKILPNKGSYEYIISGKSCLAGDNFGCFQFEHALKIGDQLSIEDAGGYSMVKKNWFNGVEMPAIAIKELDGTIRLQKTFNYQDYKASLS